ncbi:hypothetical protein PQQ63_15190 [Paraburkholderia metrosideri]|uniref:DUF2970 domain-containing protein n=1 Tax=Paraburkholderia metrosideri TaxID=580937 RepID=A0ABW9DSH1_9BURK
MTLLYFFRRLAGRVGRVCRRVQREPVHRPSERDFELSALILGFTAGAGAMAFAMLVIVTFALRPTC